MSPDEAAEFWDGEPITFGATPTIKPANDYPAAIRSFVGTVQALAAVERERDEARAALAEMDTTVAELRAAADRLRDQRDSLLAETDVLRARIREAIRGDS